MFESSRPPTLMEASKPLDGLSFKAKNVNADVMVISGDITHFGSIQNAEELLRPLVTLQLPIFFVPGNCDPPSLAEINLKNTRCIHGSCEPYDNVMFVGVGGEPVTPFQHTL